MVDKLGGKRTNAGTRQDKEKEEINQAVLEYLVKHGYSETADKFKDEAKVRFEEK
jgi:hypothetical protein